MRHWWLAGALIALVQALYFLPGYRLSGDDVLFFSAALHGWDAVFDFSYMVAAHQGRIGGFIIVPLNSFAAMYSEYAWFRAAVIAFDFGTLALFAVWVNAVLRDGFGGLLFVCLAAFHSLDFMHLSPSAFPLQNTLPFALIFGARLLILAKAWAPYKAGAHVLTGLAMLSSEYAFLVGSAVLTCEYLIFFKGTEFRNGILKALRAPRFWADVAIVVVVFAIYVGWRLAHPSSYEGNQLGIYSLSAFLKTWSMHAFGLLGMPLYKPKPSSLTDIFAMLLVGALVTRCLLQADRLRLGRLGWQLGIVGLTLALFIALPASATARNQQVCAAYLLDCIFLDSRAAYFFAILGSVSILLSVLNLLRPRWRVATTCVVGMLSCLSIAHNSRSSSRMSEVDTVWKAAASAACDTLNMPEPSTVIDPKGLVRMHPEGADKRFYPSRDQFWGSYLAWKRRNGC